MALDKAALLGRIDELLAIQFTAGDQQSIYESAVEVMQGAVTIARAIYGDERESPQLQTLMKAAQAAREQRTHISHAFLTYVWPAARASLRAMRSDIKQDLVGSVERRAAGAVIADMLGLAKEALASNNDGGKNVAAVLTAAAYEDTIRKMGTALGGVQGRPDLADVLAALNKARIIVAISTAQGYLSFRNNSLHADWAKVDRAVVGSCIAFTEQLVLQHLS